MSHWDSDIDQTLAGLRNAAPPADLESRILARLQATPIPRPRSPRTALWLLAIPAFAALLLVIRLAHHHPSALLVLSYTAPHLSTPTLQPAPSPAPPRPPAKTRHTLATARATPAALTVSFPAPEAPLTNQELLLLRLAHRPTPGTLAIFDPHVREQRAQLAAADFKEFFKPPPVLQQPIILKDVPPEETDEPDPSKR